METAKAIGLVFIIAGLCFLWWFLQDSQTETNKGKAFNKNKEPYTNIDVDLLDNVHKLN